jgi:hypothetical protein
MDSREEGFWAAIEKPSARGSTGNAHLSLRFSFKQLRTNVSKIEKYRCWDFKNCCAFGEPQKETQSGTTSRQEHHLLDRSALHALKFVFDDRLRS